MKTELLPLSIGQMGIAWLREQYPDSAVNNIGGLMLLEDQLDFDLMAKTIKLCVQRNDALRLRLQHKKKLFPYFSILKENISQYITDDEDIQVDFRDFTEKTTQQMNDEISAMNSELMPVYNAPLYRFTMVKAPDGRDGVFVKLDHHITDAWNSALLCREVIEIYYALLHGSELPKEHRPFKEYLDRESAYVHSAQYKIDKAFWMSRYQTAPGVTCFRKTKSKSRSADSKRLNVSLGQETTQSIEQFCRKYNVTAVSLFTMLISLCLAKYNHNPEAIISTPVMLRSTVAEKNTCGALVNLLQVRTFFDEHKSFVGTLRDMDDERLASMRHLRYPYLHLMTDIYRKYRRADFKDTMLSFPTAKITTKENVSFETRWVPSTAYANPMSLYVMDIDNTGEYSLQYEYHTDTYEFGLVSAIHTDLIACLERGLAEPEAELGII